MRQVSPSKMLALLALAGLLAAGCQPADLTPSPVGNTPTGRQPPTQSPASGPAGGGKLAAPAPPVVLEHRPARGEEVPPDTPVVIRFDQPMDPASVRAAFRITPEVPGDVEVEGGVVRFTPSAPYERGTRYQVTLEGDAKSQAGLPMGHPLTFAFRAAGRLEVAEVQPADGAEDISPRPRLAVVFNRPVVPLTALDEQEMLPQPLVLTPPVQGKGEWLNTSIYTFEPTEDLAPGTTYMATVPAGLTSTGGLRLEEDFSWQFTTSAPKVLSHYPMGDLVEPTTAISVTFSYPMDRASAQALFSLQPKGSDAQVPGDFRWEEGDRTLVFQPASPLDWGVTYVARVRAGVRAREGEGATLEDETWSFRVVPLPSIVRTEPADSDREADPYGGISIFFASPMDFTTIMPHTTILPEPTQVYTYWDRYENRFYISWDKQPATAYTVTLGAEIADVYGNTLGKDYVVRFRTRDLDPLVHLIGPGYQVGVYSAYTPTVAFVNYRNVSTLEFALYQVDAETFGYLNTGDTWSRWNKFQPDPGSLVRSWTLAVKAPPNETRAAAVPLGEDGGTLAPGIYYLEVRSPEVQRVRRDYQGERHMLVVTRWNLVLKYTPEEALVWVTDLDTGEPVSNVRVRVTDGERAEASGRTDAQGLFHATFPTRAQMWEPLLVLAQDGDAWVAASSNWEGDISPWAFNLPAEFQRAHYLGYVYTDRPIYRSGQTVYWKAFLRGDDDAHYTLPGTGEEVVVTIYDGDGKRLYQEALALSGMGTVAGELTLDEEAALGYYSINVQGPGDYQFGGSFQVAEYRKPEFQVEVRTDRDTYI
ncbi:MAG: Ig-like domain-containing protein, partial [Anaerolineae bacterium]|nr:Ig-like domain-containing protein [Anaerolineae bacterium]